MGSYGTHTEMKKLKLSALPFIPALILEVAFFPSPTRGHAFPIRSEPRVGWTTINSPSKVQIWFDGKLEPAFSTITVYNSAKQRVDKGNGRVSPSDATLLEVDLAPLSPGKYWVYWSVVAVDTHRTEGDFTFTIKEKPR